MEPESHLFGENAAYLEDLEHVAAQPAPRPARSIFHAPAAPSDFSAAERQARVARLINGYRVHGHWAADVDPLDTKEIARHPELDPAFYGLVEADLDAVVPTSPMYGMPEQATIRAILDRLRKVYCGTVGVEFMNVLDPEAKRWVQQRFETLVHEPAMSRETQLRMLMLLTRADGFERFLGSRFLGNKRFSLEGAESLVPLLDLLLTEAGTHGVEDVVLGMAHRGRLNVLLNILHKPPVQMLAEFADHSTHDESWGSGDVKYHLGYNNRYITALGHVLNVSMAFNPSHLEAVNPVVEGRVRARQDRMGDATHTRVLPLLIHGDAAFAGQGLNAEVLNLSTLRGYRTGGTVHVVVNNQVGFTTSPSDARSTPYATDIARMLGIPIFHVNGEDPETVARVVKMAMEWRATFRKDVVIDMYCFRKHGHNEMDEPAFTQPLMYARIAQHPGVREVYLRSLVDRGVVDREGAQAMLRQFQDALDTALADRNVPNAPSPMGPQWVGYHSGVPDEKDTAVPEERLSTLLLALNRVPDGFHTNPKIKRLFKLREEQATLGRPLDWAAGELLAYATLVTEGHPVRISGQDVQRGTFSHRHAVLVDNESGAEYSPIDNLAAEQARFWCFNSLLSEAGVLGFEYGYSLESPEALVIWEAQFGDFANGAQVIIDNFIASGEAKWNRLSGVTMFLPHGYEGQGPEHSSARIERFLQSCAEGNLQVVNCTTPAQVFHLLRRQVLRKVRDPLVVFTPKSLLRHAQASSSLGELATGGFQRVIGDGAGRPRVVFCSGKVYYDLVEKRGNLPVALVRVEELYPFPLAAIREEIARHPGATLVWCQEEPKNMGPWPFIALELLEAGIRMEYTGRRASASPATGFHGRHEREQRELLEAALGQPPSRRES
jgi:2-oxoglutarate dehydrogenase E1 component